MAIKPIFGQRLSIKYGVLSFSQMPGLLVFVFYCQTAAEVTLFVLQWDGGTLTDWNSL